MIAQIYKIFEIFILAGCPITKIQNFGYSMEILLDIAYYFASESMYSFGVMSHAIRDDAKT